MCIAQDKYFLLTNLVKDEDCTPLIHIIYASVHYLYKQKTANIDTICTMMTNIKGNFTLQTLLLCAIIIVVMIIPECKIVLERRKG